MSRILRRIALIVVALGLVGLLTYLFWPRPVAVDMATADVGTLRVTINEDGKTRIRDKYVISAPLAGRLSRVKVKEGDEVKANETIVATISPEEPTLLDPRARAEAQARVDAAQSTLERTQADIAKNQASLDIAKLESERTQKAFAGGAATRQELDRAMATQTMREQEWRSAQLSQNVAKYELEMAQAAMLQFDEHGNSANAQLEVRSPITGKVLRVLQESAAVVQAGAAIAEVGDPADLEVVVDVLSRDAVSVELGASVTMERWGGDVPLNGRVRRIEPSAFTKVSSLGVEEQRVNVLIDLVDSPDSRKELGDGYRVDARILEWEAADALKIPAGALFREGGAWAVYCVENHRANLRKIEVGKRSDTEVQVLSGLNRGDRVIIYPSDRVVDGVRVMDTAKPQL
ncbi:MAG TPA: efflux RND transporter periplasmic adaptor subunit [Phycisphaerales bacterium]|nr:efflux RND transporter periplasmic adaptor subunit [Phycisphaerales bacterium]